jgi:hypothetical protein
MQDLRNARDDGLIHEAHLGTSIIQSRSPTKGYRRKKADTPQQEAEKLFTRWVKGEFQLTESSTEKDINMMLRYLGLEPAITVGKRIRIAQLLDALSQCSILKSTEQKKLHWVKDKVLDGVHGCYKLPPILGQGNGVPNRFQIAYIKKVFGNEHGGIDAVFPDESEVGTPLFHIERPNPDCNTAAKISTRSPIYYNTKSGSIECSSSLALS